MSRSRNRWQTNCAGLFGPAICSKSTWASLRSKPQVEDWRVVLDRLKHFSLSRGMSGDGIELRKRYDELAAQLKRIEIVLNVFERYNYKRKIRYIYTPH